MTEKNRYELGLEVSQRLWGKSMTEQIEKNLDGLSPGLREYVIEAISVYTRPSLEPKIRSLCTVSALAVLGRPEQLRAHIIGALNIGASREEVEEVLLQMALYGGIPSAIEALSVASKVFAEYQPGQQ